MADVWLARYHVPWSQVHPGSGGGQRGAVHLHRVIDNDETRLAVEDWAVTELVALTGRQTRIKRRGGDALCRGGNAGRGWYERPPHVGELADERCPRCAEMAERYGVEWPTEPQPDDAGL
jgi:hypothetical protein